MKIDPNQHTPKPSSARPVRKGPKAPAETARIFIDVTEVTRNKPSFIPSRYVE
jgi:hypothetical protein